MDLNEYQKITGETAEYGDGCSKEIYNLVYTVLGLNGEAGEVAEIIKKELRKGHTTIRYEAKTKLVDELGDVLWYLARACFELGIGLDYVAQANVDKLRERKREGTIKER